MRGSFGRIMGVQLANSFAETFAWGFVYLEARDAGHGEVTIAVFFGLMFAAAALALPVITRRVPTGPAMALGLSIRIVVLLVVLRVASLGHLMAAALIHGVFIMLFWVPYNTLFIRMTSDSDRASRSTQLFALFAVSSAVFPLLGGYLVESRGYTPVLLIACAVLAVGAVLAAAHDWGPPMEFRLVRSVRHGRRIMPMVALEGVWQGIHWILVPVGTLRMVETGSTYGAFLAFLGVMTGAASIVAGRWSDRSRDRWHPLLVSSAGVAALTLALALTQGNLAAWSVVAGVTYFFNYILMAFTFTIVAERGGMSPDDAMGNRELMLNTGRAGGAGVFIASLVAGVDMAWPLLLAAAAVLVMVAAYGRMLRHPVPTTPQGPL